MSYRVVFLLFLLTFSLVFSRVLFRGEVIFPHDNAFEAGCRHRRDDPFPSNRKFSDESNVFIPELANNLDKNRRGWLATWNPHVELGRPASQLSGLNRSYPLTNGLMLFITNPFALYTVLVLIAVGLTGIFLILFLRALGLIPVAALVAAIGLTLTTTVSYWTTFVMFLSPICWTVCLLWLLTEFLHSHSWLKALGLAFASYSLLLTGYPQLIILNAYLLGGFVFFRLRDRAKAGGSWFRPLAFLLGCAAAGAIASLPVYLDVWALARGSVRGAGLGDTFFLNVLPPVSQPADIVSFIATVIDWSWLGNAIDPAYPLSFNGLSFTIVFASLISLSFFLGRRTECLYWQIFLLACLAGTIFPQLYLFAVHHLGFGLSRIQVLAGGIIPGFVVSAYVVDALGRGKLSLSLRTLGGLLVPVAFLIRRRLRGPIRAN